MTTPQRSIRLEVHPESDLSTRTFTPGEVFYDHTTGTLVLFDGKTRGGIPMLRADLDNQTALTSVIVSDTQPTPDKLGSLWFNSVNGGLYVLYDSQWIQASNNTGASSSAPSQTSVVTTEDLNNVLSNYPTTTEVSQLLASANTIGDFIINGASFTSINANEDISLVSNGSGAVNVVGNFRITSTNNHKIFETLPNSTINFYVPNVNSLDSAVDIVGSASGTIVSPQNTGVMFHITGQPNIPSRLYNDGAGAYAGYFGRRYNGTTEAPTAVNASNLIVRLGATPYTSSGWPALTTARIDMVATENQTNSAQGNEIQFWTTAIGSNAISKIITVNSSGIVFSDSSVQNSAGIPLTQKGAANGVAALGSDGKIVSSQLPTGGITFQGVWNASTNTPTLSNSVGTAGAEYIVSVGGIVNFGAGNLTFAAGDYVIYSGSTWQRIPSSIGVSSFNSRTGAITLTTADVTNVLSAGSVANTMLLNSQVTVNPGSGLAGGGTVPLGGSVTLTNTGVTSITAGSGINISGTTGDISISADSGVNNITAGLGIIAASDQNGNVTISSDTISYYRTDAWTNTPGVLPYDLFDKSPTVASNTRYYYQIFIAGLGAGGTNGHVAFGWSSSGTATITQYSCYSRASGGSLLNSQSTYTTPYVVTSAPFTPNLTNWIINQTVQNIAYMLTGYIDIGTGGTIIPQLVHTSGAASTTWQAGSYFVLTPVGPTGANATTGTWA